MLFFIDIANREVFYGGITTNPTGAWPPKPRATSSSVIPTGSPTPERTHQRIPKSRLTSHDRVSGTHWVADLCIRLEHVLGEHTTQHEFH